MQHVQITSHKKSFFVIMAGIAGIAITLLHAYLATHYSSSNIATDPHTFARQEVRTAHTPLSQELLQPFKGQWHIHSGVLTVNDDGSATFIARAYKNCGPNVQQPCDTWKGDLIIPGIHENISITRVQDKTAYGIITDSTDNRKGQQVTLKLEPQDMLLFNKEMLCGPAAPIGNCGA